MTWTYERITALRTLWTAGRTADQIATALGGITRNAVIGKAHRLSLPARQSTFRARRRQTPSLSQTGKQLPTARSAFPTAPALSAAPPTYPATIDLAAHHCRWPEGDPKKPGFHFCGRPKDGTSSYCAHHHARAIDSKSLRTKDGRRWKKAPAAAARKRESPP